jgi:hypothetical protein
VGCHFNLRDFKSLLMFLNFKTLMFNCYFFFYVYAKQICIEFVWFALCFLGLDSCIVTCDSYFDLDVSCTIQNIFMFCCCVLPTMNHCKHWDKSTWHINFFKQIKWRKIAPKIVKPILFFGRFWKSSPNLITPSKGVHYM